MTPFIANLDIHGFRALNALKIDSFGTVNLITGKNNSGKSSLLEAIRILATGGSLRTITEILSYREELGTATDVERIYSPKDLAPFCNLFFGFPDLGSSAHGFSITASGSIPQSIARISVAINWFTRRTDRSDADRQVVTYEPVTADLFEDAESFPALDLDISGRKRVIPLDRTQRRYPPYRDTEIGPVPCVYLDPFSSRSTSQLGALWDAIALTDVEQEIVKALKVISEDIQAVSMIGSDERSMRPRTAIAKSSRYSSPIPLRTFGDGVNRWFGIVLSLCNARSGVLLVDEIENGLHYSVQAAIWRTIFRLARQLNVQVFATTHSWDCIRAFQEASMEAPEDGVLIRLTRAGDTLALTRFSEQELAIATRDQIEVR